MPQNERDTLVRVEVRQPVPEEDAFDPDDDIFPTGLYYLQESLRVSWEILVDKNGPLPVDDTYVH